MGERQACTLVSTRGSSYVECWLWVEWWVFFSKTKRGVMLKSDSLVFFFFSFLPNAHLAGVTGCVFFLMRVFITSLFVFGLRNVCYPLSH